MTEILTVFKFDWNITFRVIVTLLTTHALRKEKQCFTTLIFLSYFQIHTILKEGAKSCSWYWIFIYIISKRSKRVIVTFMLDKEPFSKIVSYCLGGPFYAFRPKFNDIPALQKENKERGTILSRYIHHLTSSSQWHILSTSKPYTHIT